MRFLIVLAAFAAVTTARCTKRRTIKGYLHPHQPHITPHPKYTPDPRCYNPRVHGPGTLYPWGQTTANCTSTSWIMRTQHDHVCQIYNGTRTTTKTHDCSSCQLEWYTDRNELHKPKYSGTASYPFPIKVTIWVCRNPTPWFKVGPQRTLPTQPVITEGTPNLLPFTTSKTTKKKTRKSKKSKTWPTSCPKATSTTSTTTSTTKRNWNYTWQPNGTQWNGNTPFLPPAPTVTLTPPLPPGPTLTPWAGDD